MNHMLEHVSHMSDKEVNWKIIRNTEDVLNLYFVKKFPKRKRITYSL